MLVASFFLLACIAHDREVQLSCDLIGRGSIKSVLQREKERENERTKEERKLERENVCVGVCVGGESERV